MKTTQTESVKTISDAKICINLQITKVFKLFTAKCEELIKEIEQSSLNFRLYIRKIPGYNKNLVQLHKIHYGHVDRHLRQIRRIKADSKFPK
jgi:hypothetical protein